MRGQVSLEFTILFLALLVAIIISTMVPGIYGLDKSVKVSAASLAHAALSNVKNNVEMLSVADAGSSKTIYIKSPPAEWDIAEGNITVSGNGFTIRTTCNIDIVNSTTVPFSTNMSTIKVVLTRYDDYVSIGFYET